MLTYSILHPKTKSKQNHPGICPYSDRCRGVSFYLTILLRSALSAVSAYLPSFGHLSFWTANPDARRYSLWWKYRCDPAILESASSVRPLSAIGWHRSGASRGIGSCADRSLSATVESLSSWNPAGSGFPLHLRIHIQGTLDYSSCRRFFDCIQTKDQLGLLVYIVVRGLSHHIEFIMFSRLW